MILLVTELDAVRSLFSEKEKELNVAVTNSTKLAQQLDDLKHGKTHGFIKELPEFTHSQQELDRLKQEIMVDL